MTRLHLRLCVLLCTGLSARAGAHHSFSEYDPGRPIELTGTLMEVHWENPHVHFTLQTRDARGRVRSWDLESNSLTVLRRTNARPEKFHIGATVKILGWPSKHSASRLFVTNVLPVGGEELVLDPQVKPHW